MGRLFLVRHAQASFLSQNYDQLSGLGEKQARHLGNYWAKRKMIFDSVGTGPSQRHRRSAQIAGEAYREAGLPFPEPVIINEFEEFRGDAVLGQSLPQLRGQDTRVRELEDAMRAAGDEMQKRAAFQRLFETVVERWVNGEIAPQGVESWREFSDRVNRGLAGLFAHANKGANAAVFTSGGPIGVAVQRALHLSDQDTLQIMWMSRNSSYSEFLFSRDRFTLSSFNSHPHLEDDSLLTYR
jgi:broad specificity phosphatase PhoE